MATQVQRRRGTTAEHLVFTGANAELTIDTDKKTVVVHDGSTVGGKALLREDMSNVTPETGRNALSLGDAALHDVGPHPDNVPRNSDLSDGAFINAGTGQYELVRLDGFSRLPAVDASLLFNIPETNDSIINRANVGINTLKLAQEQNLDVQLGINTMADMFTTQNGVDATASTNETYDGTAGNEHYNNGAGTSMSLESVDYTPSITPATVTVVVIQEDVDAITLNTDIIVEVSRDGGTTYSTAVMTDVGAFTFGSSAKRILLSDSIDVSSHPTTTTLIWRIRTPTSQALKIHGVAMQWRA